MKEQGSTILIIKSFTQNERISLKEENEYVIGRSDNADIRIEDERASRKHAILRFVEGNWKIQDNGSTNGLHVGTQKVEYAVLGSGNVCQIGNTQIFIEPEPTIEKDSRPASRSTASARSVTARPAWFFPVLVGALVLVVLFIGAAIFLPDKDAEKSGGPLVIAPPEETLVPHPSINDREIPPRVVTQKSDDGLSVDKARAREHYRVGLLFYDSGHLKRAIDEWDLAQTYDDSNTLVIKKLARAIKDIDFEISSHYKAGKSHYKYLRFYEAEQEFMIVTELSHDKNDERYLDSLKKLELIQKEK